MDVPPEYLWMVIVGFIIAFILAFGIGANDVANSFGTSVGSKVLTLRQACILATICETAGAVLLGAKVSETIRKGIIEIEPYRNDTRGPELMMVGQLSSLSGACIWLLVATFFRVPVSATHSIVGATLGFALVAQGTAGVNWKQIILIISSWVISPLLSGGISVLLFFMMKVFVIQKEDPLEPGLRVLPMIYSVTIAINVFSIVYEGPPMLNFDKIPFWGAAVASLAVAAGISIFIKMVMVPWTRDKIIKDIEDGVGIIPDEPEELSDGYKLTDTVQHRIPEAIREEDETLTSNTNLHNNNHTSTAAKKYAERSQPKQTITDKPEQGRIFSWLQILTAIFGSFAHGGNDVSNAIGPVIGLWITATTNQVAGKADTPVWILLYGGVGISIGLWIWGRRVIQTMGEDLTTITPSSGFCIELGAAMAVLIASNIGIPISTTHCKVGSVVLVGFFRSRDNVEWAIFRNIIVAWLVTLPISGGISAGLMALLKFIVIR